MTSWPHCVRRAVSPVAAALMIAALMAGPSLARPAPDGFADLVEQVGPAVVNIRVRQTVTSRLPRFAEGSPLERFNDYFGDGQGQLSAAGSGFIIDAEGVVITNNHVIAPDADRPADIIEVVLPDGRVYPGDVVGADPETDLAVIRVQTDETLPAVSFGDAEGLRVGDWVMAIGNPFGLGSTVTVGVVSARNRDINAGNFDDFIQTDAAINQGNSGGPLFTMDGRVVGVNTAIVSPSGGSVGIGFAIPADLAQAVIAQLLDSGAVRRGWIGVRIQPVDSAIAASYGLSRPRGALISGVVEEGPAAEAGLQAGDLVVAFAGDAVRDDRAFSRMVAETAPGTDVALDVLRAGAPVTLTLAIGERDGDEQSGFAALTADAPLESGGAALVIGVSVAPLTPALARQYRAAPEAEGVLVTFVDPQSEAAGVLAPGDVIEQVGWTPVTTPDAAVAAAEEAAQSGAPVLIRVTHRNGDVQFHSLRPLTAGR